MGTTKITLSVPPDIIEKAKFLAQQRGVSVSELFREFVKQEGERDEEIYKNLSPKTRKFLSLNVPPTNKSDRELLEEALMEKYGIDE